MVRNDFIEKIVILVDCFNFKNIFVNRFVSKFGIIFWYLKLIEMLIF